MKNFKNGMVNHRLVALYASLTIDEFYSIDEVRIVKYDKSYQVMPEGQTREIHREGYVRITEPVEVTWKPVNDDSIIANAVASIDEEEAAIRRELNVKLAKLHDRRNQLLALTFEPAEVES